MPKMKTHRGAAKRLRVTGTGKVAYRKSGKSHLLSKKTAKRKRSLRQGGIIGPADKKRMKRLIPYM